MLTRSSLAFLCISYTFVCLPFAASQSLLQDGTAAGASSTPATGKRPMTFADMMHMKRLGETAVSPDGKWLAYSVTSVNLEQNTRTPELWLQKIDGGDPIKISAAHPGDGGIQFAADGKRILFLSGRASGQQVWIADFDGDTGETTNARRVTNISTEADNAKWSPDGKSIAFTSAVYPDCAPITMTDFDSGDVCNSDRDAAIKDSKVKAQIFTQSLYRHWNRWMGEKKSHIFLVSVDSGAMRDLNPRETHDVPPFSVEGGGGFAFAPDSKELAFTEKLVDDEAISTNADIFTLDLTNPSARARKISTSPGGDWDPAYSPDGKYIAWRSQARDGYESDQFRLVLYDRAAKTMKDLLPNFDRWVDEFAWNPSSQAIFFISGNHGEGPIFELDLNGKMFDREVGDNELSRGGEFSDIHLPLSGSRLIATRMDVRSPSEIYQMDFGNAGVIDTDTVHASPGRGVEMRLTQLTHLNDSVLAELDLSKMESFWFPAKDGVKVEGFLIRPPGFDPNKKYPVKFLIHGGPEGNWGDVWSYRWNPELFAANGYVVIMINPRGSTGYGQAFTEAIVNDWGGKPFTDLMTGLDYAEQHYPFIDKNRECALGGSYGGYMANWILGHTDRFKCIVSHDGMFDPESAYGSTEEEWFNEWEFKGTPWDYYGKPDSENPYRKWSPALSAKNFKTPTLVVHSQLDYRLDVSEGFQLFDTLQRLDVPSKMLYFPDEGHWVLKPQNSQLWYKTVNDWVDEWTKETTSH